MLIISIFRILKVFHLFKVKLNFLAIGNIFLFYVYDTILSISFDAALTDQFTSNALKTSSSEKS